MLSDRASAVGCFWNTQQRFGSRSSELVGLTARGIGGQGVNIHDVAAWDKVLQETAKGSKGGDANEDAGGDAIAEVPRKRHRKTPSERSLEMAEIDIKAMQTAINVLQAVEGSADYVREASFYKGYVQQCSVTLQEAVKAQKVEDIKQAGRV